MEISNHHLALYYTKPTWIQSIVFWTGFATETLLSHNLSRLVTLRLSRGPHLDVVGINHLPQNGVFMLAVNHFEGHLTLDNIAAVLAATKLKRPDLQNEFFIVTGEGTRTPTNGISRLIVNILRFLIDRIYQQWRRHVIRIAADSQPSSVKSLREWRNRANQQPGLVFPEGAARLQFGAVRPNAGRWLGTLPIPIVPVGVWWYKEKWHINFGRPIKWSQRSDLHDLQLGLAIAQLLPIDLAIYWQEDLQRWHLAHQQTV
jgi:hypothetical protein